MVGGKKISRTDSRIMKIGRFWPGASVRVDNQDNEEPSTASFDERVPCDVLAQNVSFLLGK